MKNRTRKPKKDFMGVYKKFYNPHKEGFGNPQDWQNAFNERMGINEARTTLNDADPYEVLGLKPNATLDEVKKAYREAAMKFHPDRFGDPEQFKRAQAAYEILETHFN